MLNDSYRSVKVIAYDDELWLLRQPQPAMADLLEARDQLIILRHGRPPYAVVLGVPHHADVHEDHICELRLDAAGHPQPRDADKNAAAYPLVAFTALRDRDIACKLVVMAHATTHDPNKELDSPYATALFAEPARMLVECHAAGPHRRHALEVSAGDNPLAEPLRFGRLLDAALGRRYTWGIQTQPGNRAALILRADGSEESGELELSALNTPTLTEAARRGAPALHIEAKPAFCKPADGTNTVTPDGLMLGRALAQALIRYFSPAGDQ